jgi:intracellular multiplication protein IcmP
MAQAAQQQQSGGDNSMAPVWIMALLLISFFFLWKFGHKQIVSFVFFLNIIQAQVITFFIGDSALSKDIYTMQTIDPGVVEWGQLVYFTEHVGNYSRYPVIAILLIMAFLLYRSDVTLKFRRVHNMNTLRQQEQGNWPAIMPIIKEDLSSTDINTGPWAMALTPMEFARKHNLLKKNDVLMDNPLPGQEMTAAIRRGDAKRIFTLQLGPTWNSFERCPPHVRALAAVFMARQNRDKDAAKKILTSIDKSFSEGKPDYSVANETLKKYQNNEIVQVIASKHAYLLTVMASLLASSRDDGVVPSSEFLWLKPVDRRLWYMLNCVGRQTPFVEVGGAFAHWRAEREMGRRSLAPMIDEAIKALEIAVKEVKLSPKELKELQP